MQAKYQATTYNPHVSHITDEAVRRIQEHEPRSRVLEAYSHLQTCQGILGGPDGVHEISFNLHITGEEDGKHMLTFKVTEGGIQYEATEEVVVRILDNVDPGTENFDILSGEVAQNKGSLRERQLLTAVSTGDKQAIEGLAYAAAYCN